MTPEKVYATIMRRGVAFKTWVSDNMQEGEEKQ